MAKMRAIYQSFHVPICTLGSNSVYEEVRNFSRMRYFNKQMNTVYRKPNCIRKVSNRNRPRRAKRKRSRKTGSRRKSHA